MGLRHIFTDQFEFAIPCHSKRCLKKLLIWFLKRFLIQGAYKMDECHGSLKNDFWKICLRKFAYLMHKIENKTTMQNYTESDRQGY